jgi:hypothetical protein
MPRQPLVPTEVAKAFVKDCRLFHAARSETRRAEIAQRQLDALAPFTSPREKLRLRDIIAMFNEMRDQA